MIINETMIRELQQRVDVSYEEAERCLKKAGGNVDIAKTYAIKRNNSFGSRGFREIEKMINSTFVYRLRIDRQEDVFMNIPIITLLVVFFLIGLNNTLRIGVVVVIWALIADCRLQFNKVERKNDFRFYNTVGKETMVDRESGKVNRPRRKAESKTGPGPYEGDGLLAEEMDGDAPEEATSGISLDSHELGEYVCESEEDDYYEVTIDK